MKTSEKSKRARAVLRTLGSLRLAVGVLTTLAAVLAVATIVESYFGTEIARRYVYGAIWFDMILLVLGLNVAAATITRWPWKTRHLGFVTTHAGILVVLAGCLATSWLAINGRMSLQQGAQDNRIVLDDWVIAAKTANGETVAQLGVGQPPRAGRTGSLAVGTQAYRVQVLQYLPDAETRAQVVEGEATDPFAVLVEIQGGTHAWQQWLVADDTGQWSIRMPGFTLAAMSRFVPQVTTETGKGTIAVTVDGQEHEVDVAQAQAGPVDIGDGQTTLRVSEYYEHASVVERKLREDPGKPANPAVVLELVSGETKDTRIVFAQFGDISQMGGMHGGAHLSIQVALKHSQSATVVAIVPRQDKLMLYEQNGGQTAPPVELPLDTPVKIQRMAMTLVARKHLAHGRGDMVVVPRPAGQQGEPQPAVQVALERPGWQERSWLAWGEPTSLGSGSEKVDLVLQERRVALPFAVKLNRFDVEEYPGTGRAAMYRSNVTVSDEALHEQRTVDIEMNRPLEYEGWSFFQSSYSIDAQHNQRVSILAASKDPGQAIVFWGATLLVAGTVILAIERLVLQGRGKSKGDAVTRRHGDAVTQGSDNGTGGQPSGISRGKTTHIETDHA